MLQTASGQVADQHTFTFASDRQRTFCRSSRLNEKNLPAHIEQGYQLETDSLGGNPGLRRLKDNEVLRPPDANASTVKALQQRGLIRPRTRSRSAHDSVASERERTVGAHPIEWHASTPFSEILYFYLNRAVDAL